MELQLAALPVLTANGLQPIRAVKINNSQVETTYKTQSIPNQKPQEQVQSVSESGKMTRVSQFEGQQQRNRMAFNFKKDAAWKPLIRCFRRFLKKVALPRETYLMIRTKPLPEQGPLLCKALGVPAELMREPKTAFALLLMVNSHRITHRKQLVPTARRMMGRFASEIWYRYQDVFDENSSRQRLALFTDPLI